MRIAYDAQIFLQRHGGVCRYFVELASHLAALGESPRIIAGLHKNSYLAELPQQVSGLNFSRCPQKLNRLLVAANTLWFRAETRIWKPDLIHETFFARNGTGGSRIPVVTTVYDMIHELYPSNFKDAAEVSECKKRSVQRAQHVICISGSTKQDLIRLWGVPESKLSVIHLASQKASGQQELKTVSARAPNSPHIGIEYGMAVPAGAPEFLLYVGQRAGYKNFNTFIQALAAQADLMGNFNVVAFGGGAFTSGEMSDFAKLGFRPGQISQVTGSDALLTEYYRSASALVYPSLYEGFGLPPLEAMAQSCPVIASNTSSMPEVLGQAVEYFDPLSVDGLGQAMRNVLGNSSRKADLIAAGLERVNCFSWARCASETLDLYRKIA